MPHPITEGIPIARVAWAQLPKHGHEAKDCQDAVAVVDGAVLKVAIADGATKSSGARLWAQLLTQLAARTLGDELREAARDEWLSASRLQWRTEHQAQSLTAGQWFNVHAAHRPAAATLLTVEIARVDGAKRWRARAIGDSCVLHYGRDSGLFVAPITRVEDFGLHPDLLSSHADERDKPKRWHVSEGELADGDLLVLATDAVAKYLVSAPEAREALRGLRDDDGVRSYLQRLQAADVVDDDDLTLVVVHPGSTGSRPRAEPRKPRPTLSSGPASGAKPRVPAADGLSLPKSQPRRPRRPRAPVDQPNDLGPVSPQKSRSDWSSKAALVAMVVVVSTITHMALRAAEAWWEPRGPEVPKFDALSIEAEGPMNLGGSSTGGGIVVVEDGDESGLQAGLDLSTATHAAGDVHHNRESEDGLDVWFCCDFQNRSEDHELFVKVRADLQARGETGDPLGWYMPKGDHQVLDRHDKEWERGCSEWCRTKVKPASPTPPK